jgi:hypothetical protein
MNNTPETNNLLSELGTLERHNCPELLVVHARKLKRERDEAREERIYAKNEMRKWMVFAQGAALHRDEAIKAFKELWQMSETLLPEISEEQSERWHNVIFTK